MDVLKILQERIAGLPEGDYTLGLSAVVQHVEVAIKHLNRGHATDDYTAFTDAIFRTNQAFEGSLKEAFHVLTGKDSSRETPNSIEQYFQQQGVLRPRVLAQFTNYRREWRNPSTHDYRLNFDDDEALVAILAVSAFAIVLVDQIEGQVAFERAKASVSPVLATTTEALIKLVPDLIEKFVPQFNAVSGTKKDLRESEIVGALAGFLSSAVPDIVVQIEGKLVAESSARADLVLVRGSERLLVEVKRSGPTGKLLSTEGVVQVSSYMALSGITDAILFNYSAPNRGTVIRLEEPAQGVDGKIIIVATEK